MRHRSARFSRRWRGSVVALGCVASLLSTTGTVSSAHASTAADDIVYRVPGTNVVCYGGDTSGPTLGALKAANDPSGWATTSSATQDLLNHTYSGTTCKAAWAGVIDQLTAFISGMGVSTPTIQPVLVPLAQPSDPMSCWSPSDFPASYKNCNNTGTEPFGECPPSSNLGTLANPGCVTTYMEMDSTLYPDDRYRFYGIEQIEADIYLANDTGTWTPNTAVFNDNHGNRATSIVQDPFYTFDYGNHRGYGTTIHGSFDYSFYLRPKSIGLQDVLDAFFGVVEMLGERVHLAYKATLHQSCPCGTAPDEAYCYFSDWAANDELLAVDRCVNP